MRGHTRPLRRSTRGPVIVEEATPDTGHPAAEASTWLEAGAFWQVALFLGAHAALGLAMRGNSLLSTAHAAITLGVGFWFAAGRRLDRAAMAVAYMAGAEVLWRMTGALVPWEFAKYGATVIMLVGLVRTSLSRPPLLPLLFFVLLLPSCVLTLQNEPFGLAQDQISLYLSGPLALMVGAWFFSHRQVTGAMLRGLLLAALAPTVGIAAISVFGTFSSLTIQFQNSSNFVASGGFGPNQVSAALSFGAIVTLLLTTERHLSRSTRLLTAGLLIALTTQSAMTFSRGGLYMAAGGAVGLAVYAARDPSVRLRLAALAVVLFVAGNYVILPYLDSFTAGGLSSRFQNLSTTGRDRLIQADLDSWESSILFGVGPGEGRAARGLAVFDRDSTGAVTAAATAQSSAAHSEFSRILAEHGTFGLVAMLLLIIAVTLNLRRAPDMRSKGILAALIAWSFLFTMTEAFRCFAPALALALGFATLDPEPSNLPDTQSSDAIGGRFRSGRLRPLMSGHPDDTDRVLFP